MIDELINKLYHNPVVAKIIPNMASKLRGDLKGCKSVLDIGCGPSSPIQYFKGIKYSVGVEVYEPYFEVSKAKKIHSVYLNRNIEALDFEENSFDAVILIEVIEHMPEDQASKVIKNAKRWSKNKVIITTPNGFVPQKSLDGNPFQEHLSGWTVDTMEKIGFKLNGMAGFKLLRQEVQSNTMGDSLLVSIRWQPKFLWFIISTLSQIMTYHFPKLAFGLYCRYEK